MKIQNNEVTDVTGVVDKLKDMAEKSGVELNFDCTVEGMILNIRWENEEDKKCIVIEVVKEE